MQHWEIVNQSLHAVSETPQQLWENACRYFKWCDDHPLELPFTVRSGKEAGLNKIEKKTRLYSIKALCLHCGFDEEYLRDVRNTKAKDSMFYNVVSKIVYIIYVQNLELTAAEYYSPVFMSKVLNIDKEDVPTSAIKVIQESSVPALSTSENDILEKLESEWSTPENITAEKLKEQYSQKEEK